MTAILDILAEKNMLKGLVRRELSLGCIRITEGLVKPRAEDILAQNEIAEEKNMYLISLTICVTGEKKDLYMETILKALFFEKKIIQGHIIPTKKKFYRVLSVGIPCFKIDYHNKIQ